MSEIICDVCPHACHLQEDRTGFCRARRNVNGDNICDNYGRVTSLAIDPVEKKPLYGFMRGSRILSLGSYGCNLACPFCQNHDISMHDETDTEYIGLMPEELLELCLRHPESIGAAFTYNEPLIAWEYYRDCAKLLKEHGLKTVLVTNGCVNIPILEEIMPYTDAMNIDLKGDREFYKELRGDYDTVRDAIAYCSRYAHVEVTALIIPGKNDSEDLMREHAQWLASLDPDMYLHITRYFPRYKYRIPPADKEVLYRLKDIAGEYLKHVYLGNVW
ncbi:MAG: AmmeMemoRadiSam system radical SAM enzyme [Solobacterium sp.]|nr:AmmeMemoRadiSam system radical SAM enzyme [Solobacterium sp.]